MDFQMACLTGVIMRWMNCVIAARVRMGTEPHSKARVLDVVAGYQAEQVQGQPEVRLQAAQDLPFLIMQKRRRQLATRCC